MKQLKILSILLFLSVPLAAQNKVETIEFGVAGICGMCKERIENALDVKGIKFAEYNQETHQCKVVYRTDKITEEEIHDLLNEVGHDTGKSKATDEQYARVHKCCRYREGHDH